MARVRGEELTGFQRREAGGRGGGERRLRLKRRFVSDQRAGAEEDGSVEEAGGADGADEAAGVRGGAVMTGGVVLRARVVRLRLLGERGPCGPERAMSGWLAGGCSDDSPSSSLCVLLGRCSPVYHCKFEPGCRSSSAAPGRTDTLEVGVVVSREVVL